MLQYVLNELDGYGLKLDGSFGDKTASALKQSYNLNQVSFVDARMIYNDFLNEKKGQADATPL